MWVFARSILHSGVDPTSSLEEAVRRVKPTVLVGAAAVPAVFTKGVVEAMCASAPRPVIFALSNPPSKAECTAEQAYEWSKGKAVFASGRELVTINSTITREKTAFY